MKRVIIEEVEKYEDGKYVRPVLFKGEMRARRRELFAALRGGITSGVTVTALR